MPQHVAVRTWLLGCLGVAMLGYAAPLWRALHRFAAGIRRHQTADITGTIADAKWKNPHIWFYLDVKNADGTTTRWGFAGGAPGQLMRRGITKAQLKLGKTVVVEGFRAKDGSNNGSGGRVASGRPQRADRRRSRIVCPALRHASPSPAHFLRDEYAHDLFPAGRSRARRDRRCLW